MSDLASIWPQPLTPLHSPALSSLVAAIPLAVVLVLMGGLRKSGLFASACGLASAVILAVAVWRMPALLAGWSIVFGFGYALWSILWLVFCGLWLYHLAEATGSFDLLRQWVEQSAPGDACVQAMLVAFCFGALLEGTAGFGTPVAVTALLLVKLGFEARKAVVVALLANTAPVAFGAVGVPIVALAGVTGIDIQKLSAMIGRQLPFVSLILPAYLALLVAGGKGLRRSWQPALVAGGSFALVQFLVSNLWGPYATDLLSALASIIALVSYLRLTSSSRADREPAGLAGEGARQPAPQGAKISQQGADLARQGGRSSLSASQILSACLPWALLSVVIVLWSYFKLFPKGQIPIPIPHLHNGVFITLYQKPYAAIYNFQPLAAGTGLLLAIFLTALCFRVRPKVFLESGARSLRQLRLPGLTVLFIVALAYLYNYSGMAFTLGATFAQAGFIFPLLSSFLGWVACFLSGSDTAANLLFGNLQVAAAHQLHLNPVLLAATNSSGAVAGKMISPQNIAIGVTTVGLIGDEGKVLHSTFWHSVLLATLIGLIACIQAYCIPGMVP
jgi:L-lactate transport